MSSHEKKQFISSTNVGGREDDELKPRIESEYTTEWQAIRKMVADYYSDKPFKDVTRFPAQILRVLDEADFKKDNYLNTLASGISQNLIPRDSNFSSTVIKKIKGFAGFGDKRYKARVLDLDIALPPVESAGDKNLDPLTTIPTDANEAKTLNDNLLIEYIYITEFIPRDGISCDVGDIVIVSFDNKNNRTFGIIEHKISGAPVQSNTPDSQESYKNPSSADSGPPNPNNLNDPTNSNEEYLDVEAWASGKKLPNNIKVKKVFGKYIRVDAANALEKLIAAAKAENINLRISSGYRSMSLQISLYNERYTPGYPEPREKNVKKILPNGKKPPTTAYPGRSNHQNGIAIDFDIPIDGWNTKEYQWLDKNASRFGFSNAEGKLASVDEAWHWVYTG